MSAELLPGVDESVLLSQARRCQHFRGPPQPGTQSPGRSWRRDTVAAGDGETRAAGRQPDGGQRSASRPARAPEPGGQTFIHLPARRSETRSRCGVYHGTQPVEIWAGRGTGIGCRARRLARPAESTSALQVPLAAARIFQIDQRRELMSRRTSILIVAGANESMGSHACLATATVGGRLSVARNGCLHRESPLEYRPAVISLLDLAEAPRSAWQSARVELKRRPASRVGDAPDDIVTHREPVERKAFERRIQSARVRRLGEPRPAEHSGAVTCRCTGGAEWAIRAGGQSIGLSAGIMPDYAAAQRWIASVAVAGRCPVPGTPRSPSDQRQETALLALVGEGLQIPAHPFHRGTTRPGRSSAELTRHLRAPAALRLSVPGCLWDRGRPPTRPLEVHRQT